MTNIKRYSILILAAMVMTLGCPAQTPALAAARPVETPQTTSRFVVFEAFLNPT
jgi:hypothetical protein